MSRFNHAHTSEDCEMDMFPYLTAEDVERIDLRRVIECALLHATCHSLQYDHDEGESMRLVDVIALAGPYDTIREAREDIHRIADDVSCAVFVCIKAVLTEGKES